MAPWAVVIGSQLQHVQLRSLPGRAHLLWDVARARGRGVVRGDLEKAEMVPEPAAVKLGESSAVLLRGGSRRVRGKLAWVRAAAERRTNPSRSPAALFLADGWWWW